MAVGVRRYTVLLIPEPEEGGFSVRIPALPACFTQGETAEESLANAREAIVFHLQSLAEEGEPLPEDHVLIEQIEVEAVA